MDLYPWQPTRTVLAKKKTIRCDKTLCIGLVKSHQGAVFLEGRWNDHAILSWPKEHNLHDIKNEE
jgi:hypothetical protein